MVERLPENGSPSTEVLGQEAERFRQAKIEATETGGEVPFEVGGEKYKISDPKRAGCQVEPLRPS